MTPLQTTADVLDAAADLLSAPGAWTRGACARDAKGRELLNHEHAAVCFCALGAILKSGGGPIDADDAFGRFVGGDDWSAIGPWNDAPGRTQSEVVAVLRKAAAAERAALSDMQPTVAGEGVGA